MNELITIRKDLRAIKRDLKPTKRTERSITWSDVRDAIRASKQAKSRVRVYSSDGFVPNSYQWRCLIQWVEVTRREGKLAVTTGWSSAQRSKGAGNLFVVK